MDNNHPSINWTPSTFSHVEFDLHNLPIETPEEDELVPIIKALKIGALMAQYTKGGRFEKKTFHINLEEFKISWSRLGGGGNKEEDGSIPIEEIKEVQRGCASKDFANIIRKIENPDLCIVIVYGNKFTLKTLSCLAQNATERDYWVKALVFLKHKNQHVPPIALAHRWFCREWSLLPKNNEKRMSIREYKIFLQKANIKVTNNKKIGEIFQSVAENSDSIDAIQFFQMYNKLLHVPAIGQRYEKYFHTGDDGLYMTPSDFQRFLLEKQKDRKANDIQYVYDIMQYVKPVDNGKQKIIEFNPDSLYFIMTDFLRFLFHPMNSVFNDEHRVIYQDMTKPLSSYWIASSHNTYLTGDQMVSQSSEEAYIRALRMGCRCVELDCWDGPNNEPIIYHGHTRTTKIKFVDVVKVIANNAFAVSEYPLILSIENHCSIPQQVVMAQIFERCLGNYLITDYYDPNETQLPSPEALKHKIILKQKKLQTDNEKDSVRQPVAADDSPLERPEKTGVMYMKDEFDNWNKHLVVLCGNSLFYSNPQVDDVDSEDDEQDDKSGRGEGNEDELHFGEKWFHHFIDRVASETLLKESQKGDGSFLVRPSANFDGDFTLSFSYKNKVKHVHIERKKYRDGSRKFFVEKRKYFENLYSLINYYQCNPIRTEKFELILREPVPEPDAHLGKDWYHENLTRPQAEYMLKRMSKDGYFLVRKHIPDFSDEPESYAISFRTAGTIKHCRIHTNERLYMIGDAPFESMTELIKNYKKSPLYRKTKLKYPCTQKVAQECGENPDKNSESEDCYTLPNLSNLEAAYRAKYNYDGRQEDELSFVKGALILNIKKYSGGWWRGDYNGQVQKWFPVQFTESIKEEDTVNEIVDKPTRWNRNSHFEAKNSDDSQQQTNIIDLTDCHPQISLSNSTQQNVFEISIKNNATINFSVPSKVEMIEWLSYIQDASELAVSKQIKLKEEVKSRKVAKELSELVVYCVPRPFTEEALTKGKYYEMSSLVESKMEKLSSHSSYDLRMLKYNERQLTRVYPKATRIVSSNYNPVPFWNFGVQMSAMNYQTDDRAMQIERGTFMDNGGCGYVLKPSILRDSQFDPFKPNTFQNIEPLYFRITIIAARYLRKISKGLTSPFIQIEIIGADCDANIFRTRTNNINGLCPTWFHESFEFHILCPPLAKIHFVVKNEDMFGDDSFIAQACFPVTSLREGHRSVPLKNSFSEELPLSALLIEICTQNAGEDEEYAPISLLHDKLQSLSDIQNSQLTDETDIEKQLRMFQSQISLEGSAD